jgi:hypothetical protein
MRDDGARLRFKCFGPVKRAGWWVEHKVTVVQQNMAAEDTEDNRLNWDPCS